MPTPGFRVPPGCAESGLVEFVRPLIPSMSSTVRFELAKGERLLWSGVPRQGVLFRPSDALMIPFSLLWAGFAVFWELSVIRDGAPFFFALWGIPFILVGAYITVGRFFGDARRRSNTAYGLTNERIIISSGIFRPALKSLTLRTLSDLTLNQRSDGSGTITFGPTSPFTALNGGLDWPGMPRPPAFEFIPNAKQVYDMIREAQREASQPAA